MDAPSVPGVGSPHGVAARRTVGHRHQVGLRKPAPRDSDTGDHGASLRLDMSHQLPRGAAEKVDGPTSGCKIKKKRARLLNIGVLGILLAEESLWSTWQTDSYWCRKRRRPATWIQHMAIGGFQELGGRCNRYFIYVIKISYLYFTYICIEMSGYM